MPSSQVPIRVREHDEIKLSDGTILSAMIWLPTDAETNPVPAILEYSPYRKRDWTAARDASNHPYVASHGYAGVRVDMRGSGDSEGLSLGEYLKQEQDDCLEVLEWIAAQPWCTGSIGMIGISWGGFNGSQVAARRPPQSKAVVSMCSTDDRYNDDIHYQGGCMLVDNFSWGATMFGMNPTPPDPASVGDKWRDIWMKRIETGGLYMSDWLTHQRRDDFWKHASICEDYSSIQCPVYVVGGWMDPYTNTVFRMMDHLKCPKKGSVGPWAHKYPNFAKPGPAIGFLQETIRWWDKWSKGKETGIMDEPPSRCYLQDPAPPQTHYEFRPGHWVAESSWPSKDIKPQRMHLAPGRLVDEKPTSVDKVSICSPQTVGSAAGRWCIFGLDADEPGDQRQEAGASLVFDTQPLDKSLDILGAVILRSRIASNKPNALIAAVLSEILPDGSATRISVGSLNSTHRNSHEDLEALEPGKFYDVELKMNDCGQRLGVGNRIRLALSTSYFPIAWPSPEAATSTVDCAHSTVDFPKRPESSSDSQLKAFEPAVNGAPLQTTVLRAPSSSNTVTQDINTGEVTYCFDKDEGLLKKKDDGWTFGATETVICAIRPDDPLSACAEQHFKKEYARDDMDSEMTVSGWTKMTSTKTEYSMTARLDAWEKDKQIFGQDYAFAFPRDHA